LDKRLNLLLLDPERLLRILTGPQRLVQLIIAGKAYPANEQGRAMISQWIHFIHRPEVRKHVIFLSDYDTLLTERRGQHFFTYSRDYGRQEVNTSSERRP
jgi:starch phosphorylase